MKPLSFVLATMALVSAAPAWAAPPASTELDVPYVPGGGHKQQLDLYLPDNPGFATVLLVHGGSLDSGDRKEAPFPALCQTFRSAGFACAAASYRLFPDHPWPAAIQDVAAAFAWLKRNIAARGGNPARIFLLGHSSGARLVSLLAADQNHLRAHGLSAQDIAGCVSMGSILHIEHKLAEAKDRLPEEIARGFEASREGKLYGSFRAYHDSWAFYHVGRHLPPMLLLVAEEEIEHPPILAHSQDFTRAAERAGASVRVEVLQGRTHMSAIEKMTDPSDPTFLLVVSFLRGQ